jgi:hypothetical protein
MMFIIGTNVDTTNPPHTTNAQKDARTTKRILFMKCVTYYPLL